MKRLPRKTYLWALIVFALITVATTAISTMAWFTMVAPPPTSLVTGGAEVSIEKVTGYKVQETRKNNGYIDRDNNIPISKEIGSDDFSTTTNDNLEGADTDFDVPSKGIGYYLLKPNHNNVYKFSDLDRNYEKFVAYDHGNVLSVTLNLTTAQPFLIRSYQMSSNKTDLQTIDLQGVGGDGTLNDVSHAVTVNSDGNYKIWYDTSVKKVGVERLGDIVVNNGLVANPKRLSNTGGQVVWLNISDHKWSSNSAKIVLDTYNGSGHQWTQMTCSSDSNYYYATIPSGTWNKIIFVRANSAWTSGVDWNQKWNQTGDLDFPGDPNNCYKLTSYGGSDWTASGNWEQYHPAQVKVGNGNYTDMSWVNGEWKYQISGSVDDGTSLSFKKYGVVISVSPSADGDGLNKNNFTSSSTIKCGGNNLNIYLHTDNTAWVDPASDYFVAIGSTYHKMSYDSVESGGQWELENLSVSEDNTSISISYSKLVTISVTASDDTSNPWHNKNNFDGSKIKGGGTVNVYYHPNDDTVWVSSVVKIRSGANDYVQMSDNPDNTDELCATGMTVTEDEVVSMKVNGAAFTDFTAKSADLNNIGSDLKIIKSATNAGMYLSKTNKDLWVDGNKTYNLSVGGSNLGEMVYQSGGTYDGWVGIQDVTVTAAAVTVNLTTRDGSVAQTLVKDTDYTYNNFDTGNVLRGGTVDVYYNTSNNHIVITTVYGIKVGNTDLNAATSDGITYTATFSNLAGGSNVKVYANTTELTSYTPEAARSDPATKNNCSGSAGALKTIYDTTGDTAVSFNTSNTTVWVDGYDPCYYYRVGTTGNWTKMTNKGDDAQVYASITAGQGDIIHFRKNAAGEVFVGSAMPADHLNNYGEGGALLYGITAQKVYLNYNTKQVWIPGRVVSFNFYTDTGASPYAYFFQNGTENKNADYPGVAMDDASEIAEGVYTASFTVHEDYVFDRAIFNLGAGESQSVDIDIKSTDYSGKYIYLTNNTDDSGHYYIASYDNPPDNSKDTTIYVHDPNHAFGSGQDVHFYAWDSTGATMPIQAFPGQVMTALIPGSLWKYDIAESYDGFKFTNAACVDGQYAEGAAQTGDFVTAEHEGGYYVADGVDNHSVYGNWSTEQSEPTINARIYIGSDTTGVEMALGDRTTSNNYIYESGLQARHGDTLRVVADDVTYKDSSNFVQDDVSRPYLNITDSSITVKLGAAGETARFNFYITTSGELAIVMVPDLGNGFYIMPYQGSTEGFVAAKKMSSTTSSSAMYAGYYATKGTRVFVRSYLDAVDQEYRLDDGVSSDVATTVDTDESGLAIEFQQTSYFTIEVAEGKVSVRPFTISEFLHLNALDVNGITGQDGIRAQHTSMVFQVEFKTTANSFEMYPAISVTNDNPNYVGAAVAFSKTKQLSPYIYMNADARYVYNGTTNPNGLTVRGSSFELSDPNYLTTVNNSTKMYYAYLLIDYVYNPSFLPTTMPYNMSSKMAFHLRMVQA